jgi:hypothetical protein
MFASPQKRVKRRGEKMGISEILYFDEPGPSNTRKLLEYAKKRAEDLKIKHIIMASDRGGTVRAFLDVAKENQFSILVVTNDKGLKMPVSILAESYKESKEIKQDYLRRGISEIPISLSDDVLAELERKKVTVYFVPDTIQKMRKTLDPFLPKHLRPLDIEAGMDLSLLNIISWGFRVCVGIAAISVKSGFVPEGEIILSIAGSGLAGGGADTAVIIEAHSNPKACHTREVLGFPRLGGEREK